MKRCQIIVMFAALLCGVDGARADSPNILLVIADDLGLDVVPGYLQGPQKARMPNLEALAASGISFDNVWANPLCSPTRASMLTGKIGARTGVLNAEELSLLPSDEKILHEYLSDASDGRYASAIIGKWHLSGRGNPDASYPQTVGVPFYQGLITGGVDDYSNWLFTDNGQQMRSTQYITTELTDLAIDWIGQRSDDPWFLWLAYTAPHTPFHLPPTALHSQGQLSEDPMAISANPMPYFLAMVESLDTELGRLLASMSDAQRANTLIIFVGDNGTDRRVIQSPYGQNQGKGTLYQGGVHVPMVVSGAGVDRLGEREPALIQISDLFSTVLELAGARAPALRDSVSFRPLLSAGGTGARQLLYAELGGQGVVNGWAARDQQFKLISTTDSTELYDLDVDPYERSNLIDDAGNTQAQAAALRLRDEVDQLLAAPSVDGSYSGTWFNPQRSGEGLQIELGNRDSPTAVIGFYTYAAGGSGEQIWLAGAGPISGDGFSAEVQLTDGGRFGPTFDPAAVSFTPWGSIDVRFTSCTTAVLEYRSSFSDYGSGQIELSRLTAPLLDVIGECSP